MFCEQCGVEIRFAAEFCEGCGAPVAAAPNRPSQAPAVQEGIKSITKEQLNLAGWLSVIKAAVSIPLTGMSIFLGAVSGTGTKVVFAMLTLVSLGLFVYIFSSLKRLLNSRFKFHDVDTYISVFIWVNVVFSALGILSSASSELKTLVGLLSLLALIPFGIVFIVFAVRILRLSDSLYGFLKPFSYTSIVAGLCYATIILIPLGLVAEAVADVILGMIFFRVAERY
jgi:hypothetical protein